MMVSVNVNLTSKKPDVTNVNRVTREEVVTNVYQSIIKRMVGSVLKEFVIPKELKNAHQVELVNAN